jgi:hypothetical protein
MLGACVAGTNGSFITLSNGTNYKALSFTTYDTRFNYYYFWNKLF